MSTTTPRERVEEMSEREKDELLLRVADDTDDPAIERICELAAHSSEVSTS